MSKRRMRCFFDRKRKSNSFSIPRLNEQASPVNRFRGYPACRVIGKLDFSHPEIAQRDQSRISLLATMLRNLRLDLRITLGRTPGLAFPSSMGAIGRTATVAEKLPAHRGGSSLAPAHLTELKNPRYIPSLCQGERRDADRRRAREECLQQTPEQPVWLSAVRLRTSCSIPLPSSGIPRSTAENPNPEAPTYTTTF